jgi:hypothetical protein
MIQLTRTLEPGQLVRNKATQLANFLASGNKRPHSYQYSSAPIKNELCSISFYKCYYCERKLSGLPKEVDHYIEISCDKTKALDWDNLFLSCDNCNGKIPHNQIAVTDALNPFVNTDVEIEQNITFKLEAINSNNGSMLGLNTIKKFRLDSEQLDLIRARFLNIFFDEMTTIQKKCAEDGNRDMTDDEKNKLRTYSYPDHPFSLMFKVILRKKGLL